MSNKGFWNEHKDRLGKLYTTRGVFEKMNTDEKFYSFVWDSLRRYVKNDWGEMVDEDKQRNDEAVKAGDERIFAAYEKDSTKIWIITEADRKATTILFPEEY